MFCPLCGSGETLLFCEVHLPGVQSRSYFKCSVCALIFLSPSERLDKIAEKLHYDSHCNDPKDERYLNFLRRLSEPLSLKLTPGAEGIDFGCGPGPAMSVLFREKGFKMENYDPFYFPDRALLERFYDFAACSEVIEHFFEPGREFQLLNGLLKKGGFLGVMTGMVEDEASFSNWWYLKDPTHVCFYQKKTFEWMARRYSWSLEFPQVNVVIFQK